VKLGTKLFLWLSVPLILLISIIGFLEEQAGRRGLREELQREGRAVTRTMQLALEDALRDRQSEDIRELVERISGYERIYGVRVFDAQGELELQSMSLEAYPFGNKEALGSVLRDGRPRETYRTIEDQPVVTFLAPLDLPDGTRVGAVQVLQLESYIDEDALAGRNFIFALTAALILAAGAVILVVTRVHVARPVAELVRRFREIGAVESPRPIPVRRRDELGRLAEEFNGMCRRLEESQRSLEAEQAERRSMEEKLRDAERLASVGRFAAGLAHEIGTPMNVIRGRAESLQRKLAGQPHTDKGLSIIIAQIDRITGIVSGMLDFARAREPKLAPTDVGALLHRVLEFMANRIEENRVRLVTAIDAGLPQLEADGDRLQQLFLNLIGNALDAMPEGGVLRVRAREDTASPPEGGEPGSVLAIDFEDDGVGIAARDLPHIFDPFFTTKEVGRGTGLGLSISYGIVREHGGWIGVRSAIGDGTLLTVHLPLREASHRASSPDPGSAP